MSVLLTNIWLLLGSITLGGVLNVPKALGYVGRIVSTARALLRSSQNLMGRVRDAQKRSALEKEQQAAQKSIEKMETQVKEAAPKNPTGKTDKEIRDIAEKIAKGHAWEKHKNEYPEIKTKEDLQKFVEEIMKKADDIKEVERDRTAYWHNDSGSIVIHDPNHVDQGTVFKPDTGKDYFDNDFN